MKSIRNIFKKLSTSWQHFFFEPISPASIGLFRIVFGIVIFLSVLGKYPSREIFYGIDGIVSSKSLDIFFPGNHYLNFRWMPLSEPYLGYYFIGLLAATLSFIFGFYTRISSILVFLGLISLSNRNFFVDNAGDDLMRINCFFIMFSQAGSAFSIDRLLRRKKGIEGKALRKSAPWAQRLLQLQLVYLYFETAMLKLYGPSWLDGSALYYSFNYLELRRFDFRDYFSHLWQIQLASYATLIAEFAAFSLIWIRKFRYSVIIVAAILHLSINLMMQFPVFQYVMIASLINFLYPEDIEKAVQWLLRASKRLLSTDAKSVSC